MIKEVKIKKQKYLYVNALGDEYPSCPLRDDQNICSVYEQSNVNDCPSLLENGAWDLPDL
ncbi:MAG: hypothetical protein ACOCUL_01560 [Bacteroidota bacterium]